MYAGLRSMVAKYALVPKCISSLTGSCSTYHVSGDETTDKKEQTKVYIAYHQLSTSQCRLVSSNF